MSNPTRKTKGTLEEVTNYCEGLGLPSSDAEYLFYHWEANEWTNRGKPIKDWQATVRSWRGAGYLPSQKLPAKPKPSWRVILRQVFPDYGWIPTKFYDLPSHVQEAIKKAS